MAPPSKKQKWRQLDLSATEQYIDDAALHQRVAQLEASDSLFQIDTSGCAPANNLTQRARRLLQQNLLAAEGSAGEGALLRTAPEPKTFKVVPKKPLLQVVSAQHKKQLLKIIRQQQGKEKTTSAQRQNQQCLLEAAARSLLTRPDRASRSCADAGGEREGGLEDLWPGENASSVARKGSSAPFEKKKQSGEEDVQKKQRSDPAAGNAAAGSSCGKGAPPSHERQAVNAAACSSPAAAGQQQQQTRRKRRRCTQQQEKTATEPGAAAAVHTETTEKEGVVTASDDAAAETSHGETLTSRSVAEGDVGRGVRRHKAADFPKKLTVRGLRSFDKLRPYVPVVRLPGDSESYNPSAEASACGLLAAAVRTLEEQREAQKLQRCSSRSSVTRQAEQQQNREKLELLLLANVQQQEIDQQGATRIRGGVEDAKTPQTENKEKEKAEEATEEQQEQQQGGHSRMQRIDDVLSQVLPAEKVVLLTDTQKQRLLLDLVYKGKASLPAGEELLGERQPAANGLPQQEQEWKEAQQQQKQGEETEPLTSNAKAATDVGDEEADSDEGDAAGGDALLSRVKRQEKKTRAERNRRLRFLQQQRRHAAKVAARSWRAVVDRVDVAVQQLDTEAQELARRKEEREEKLRAKILAAKQGQVRLKIGRNRLVEAPTAVQLPEDVTGSLRNAKPAVGASGALCEYVASLRRRGLLELPFTGGATGAALRHAQRQRSRRLASRKPRKRKD